MCESFCSLNIGIRWKPLIGFQGKNLLNMNNHLTIDKVNLHYNMVITMLQLPKLNYSNSISNENHWMNYYRKCDSLLEIIQPIVSTNCPHYSKMNN